MGNGDQNFKLTRIYGNPEVSPRIETWILLKSLRQNEDYAWMVFKDFNEVLKVLEKWGSRTCPESQMKTFRDYLFACDLADLGFSSSPFTWCKNSDGDQRILERI